MRVQQTMVNANGKLSVADMKKGQNDAYSPAMVEFRDILLDVMDQRPKRSRVISRLREWNGEMDASRPEPLILTAIFRHALEVIYKDDLGPVFKVAYATPAKSLSRILVQGGSRNWCDETTTNGQETCGFALAKAFDLALAELEGTLGENWRNWKWGDLHVAGHEHQPFGKIALLAKFFDVERPMSGGAYTLLRAKTKFATKRPYRATHGAGYRAIYDFSDLEKSLYSITTGQSGNVFSDRYDDQADRWAAGGYIAVPTDKTVYSESALGSWSLTPAE